MACGSSSPESDREALVALYNATDGQNWREKRSWLSDKPLGKWEDVATDDNARVIVLDLIENHLSGEIPPELGNLANLGWLYLARNELSGEIPLELGSLANLGWLYLARNELSGEIPLELGSLASLGSLVLGENQLSGCIPAGLRDQLEQNSDLGGLPFC